MNNNYRLNALIVPPIIAVGLTTEKVLPTALLHKKTHSMVKPFAVAIENDHSQKRVHDNSFFHNECLWPNYA